MMARRRSTVHLVAGARPNFMKVAPVYHGLKGEDWARTVLIHTGQHYDANMSYTFLRDLGLPAPDVALGVGSGSHAEQTARVMIAYEKICMAEPPYWVVVVGDVNSTLACALVAAKLHIRLAHLEAGLRSFDRTMPEEINRVVTDALADVLWTPSPDADANLRAEGIPAERIERVGNVMIDAYEMLAPRIAADDTRRRMGLGEDGYAVVTLHRPTNVDDAQRLGPIVAALVAVARRLPLVFPLHPRTRQKLQSLDLMDPLMASSAIHMSEPLSYITFMGLVRGARHDHHRFRWPAGGNDLPQYPLRHVARHHGASDHDLARHQPFGPRRAIGRHGGRNPRRRLAASPPARSMGRPHRPANRVEP